MSRAFDGETTGDMRVGGLVGDEWVCEGGTLGRRDVGNLPTQVPVVDCSASAVVSAMESSRVWDKLEFHCNSSLLASSFLRHAHACMCGTSSH